MEPMNIYDEAKKLGIEMGNWCSDLYLPVNEQTQKLVADYKFKKNVTTFTSNIDKKLWYEIPFAFDPYWESRVGK